MCVKTNMVLILFRITVHATTERALVDDFGFDVQPSMTTSVGLEEVVILQINLLFKDYQ